MSWVALAKGTPALPLSSAWRKISPIVYHRFPAAAAVPYRNLAAEASVPPPPPPLSASPPSPSPFFLAGTSCSCCLHPVPVPDHWILRPSEEEPEQPPTTYPTLTSSQSSEGRNQRTSGTVLHLGCITISWPRPSILAYHSKTAVDCFFAVWFVVGNVWIFGGRGTSSDAQDAPNMYRLCLAFLALCCVGYAVPFIMCAAICCCFPCLISVLRLQEDLGQSRGATQELIDALPTYKFKPKRSKNWVLDHASSSENLSEGGILGPGTKKERIVSAEDAVCCICLTKYGDDDELRELPCNHLFHVQCVDKWLKINAVCPLCKTEIGGVVRSFFGLPFGRRRVDRMTGRGVASSRFSV
ncbi:unnamed protein product [Alopecurus aequalis]